MIVLCVKCSTQMKVCSNMQEIIPKDATTEERVFTSLEFYCKTCGNNVEIEFYNPTEGEN